MFTLRDAVAPISILVYDVFMFKSSPRNVRVEISSHSELGTVGIVFQDHIQGHGKRLYVFLLVRALFGCLLSLVGTL